MENLKSYSFIKKNFIFIKSCKNLCNAQHLRTPTLFLNPTVLTYPYSTSNAFNLIKLKSHFQVHYQRN